MDYAKSKKANMGNSISTLNRRDFLSMAGAATMGMVIPSGFSFGGEIPKNRKIRMGIVGGNFGSTFYFHEHPNCIVEAVSDLIPKRRKHLMKIYNCEKSYESLEKLILDKKIDAVFIATPAPDHVRHVTTTLNAGKHVLCAVPAAWTLEECEKLRNTVKRTGLTYMMAETSVYRQNTISAKKFYDKGEFGDIFDTVAEYNHPGLGLLFYDDDGKPTWRHGMPPMHYPTHCTSFLICVTGERLTNVSCMGWGDDSFLLRNNPYHNPFWNETAFFETDRDRPFRVSVNWKGALRHGERAEWLGSQMSFISAQQAGGDHTIVRGGERVGNDTVGYRYQENTVETYDQPLWWKTDMLPKSLRHNSGHGGAHTFITHEFINALVNERQPEVNINEALAYTAPGIVAHKSALNDGEYLKIPNFDTWLNYT